MQIDTPFINNLKPVYFWDSKPGELDDQKDKNYIIRRIFELGDIEEIALVHAWYGTETCREALLSAEYLREAAIIQGMVFLDIPDRGMFKCANKKQMHKV